MMNPEKLKEKVEKQAALEEKKQTRRARRAD